MKIQRSTLVDLKDETRVLIRGMGGTDDRSHTFLYVNYNLYGST